MTEKETTERLAKIVADLTDKRKWTWTRMVSYSDAADEFLSLLEIHGFIEHMRHPSGGDVWKVNGKLYGRTDGIDLSKFRPARPKGVEV